MMKAHQFGIRKSGGLFQFCRAFTLIELLVVVSIIALLVAILLPALKKAREQGKQAVCLANLKAIATASVTYAYSDPQEQSVPVHPLTGRVKSDIGAYDWGGKAGRGDPIHAQDSLSSVWGSGEGRGPGTRPMNAILLNGSVSNNRDNPGTNQENWIADTKMAFPVLHCPSDRGFTGYHYTAFRNQGLTSFDHYGTSYCANVILAAIAPQNPDLLDVWSYGAFLRPISRIPTPGSTIYYWENCGRFGWDYENPDTCAVPLTKGLSGTDKSIRGWHGRPFEFSTVFVDSHASVVHMRGRIYPPPRTFQEHSVYYGEKCVVIRGDSWQLDCLPSAPISAGFPPKMLSTVPGGG